MATGVNTSAVELFRQFVCGLHGHDELLHFETGRLSMRCTSCGHETPGWDLKSAVSHPVSAPKARVVRLPLMSQRRVA